MFTCYQFSQSLISDQGLEVGPPGCLCLLSGGLDLHLCLLEIFHLLITFLLITETTTCLGSPARVKLFTNPFQHVEELGTIVFQLSCHFYPREPFLQATVHVYSGHDFIHFSEM